MLSDSDAIAILEAILFAAGDPVSLNSLVEITGLEESRIRDLLGQLAEKYENDPASGIRLRRLEDDFCLTSKKELKEYLARLYRPDHLPSLSNAAYETLAAVAYNQPVSRAQVEQVRGVNSDQLISRLLERGYICEAGTLDTPGRPTLFATTDKFLLEFGLDSISDLPGVDLLMYDTIASLEEE